mgnify:CR=1 FL=1
MIININDYYIKKECSKCTSCPIWGHNKYVGCYKRIKNLQEAIEAKIDGRLVLEYVAWGNPLVDE